MRNKMVWTLPMIALAIMLGSAVKTYAGTDASGRGWLWGGSEIPATLGWISMNNVDKNGIEIGGNIPYGVNIPVGNGSVTGYAWSENYGWIDFNSQKHCITSGTPSSTQYLAGSCTNPDGNSQGVERSNNNLTGYARIVSIARDSVNNNSGGWGGWIKMNNVSIVATNTLTGYGWNGEKDLGGGKVEGLGWIDFSKASVIFPEPPSLDLFTADPSTLPFNGGQSTFKWKIGGGQATECTMANTQDVADWKGSLSGSDVSNGEHSKPVRSIERTTTFTLICTGPGGTSDTESLTVTVENPLCSCKSPDELPAKDTCSTATYEVTGVGCTAQTCNGTKDCGGKWKEIAPVN